MKYITPRHMIGFNDELQKEAGRAAAFFQTAKDLFQRGPGAAYDFARSTPGKVMGGISRELKGQYGRQLGLGAGLGAAGGALVADPEEGESRLRGAVKGALVGGGIAGGRILTTQAGREAAGKGLSNFYQRQRYSLTGKGLGATEADKLKKAREIGLVEKLDPTKHTTPEALAKAQRAINVQEEALKSGYMSAPGVVHGLLSNPKDVLKSGWRRSGTVGKVFTGLGAYETGKGLIEKPEEGGPGRLEKGLRGAGSALGWMVAPTTLVGSQIIGMGGGYLGGKAGKLGDRGVQMIRRPGQVPPQATPQYAPQYPPQGGY